MGGCVPVRREIQIQNQTKKLPGRIRPGSASIGEHRRARYQQDQRVSTSENPRVGSSILPLATTPSPASPRPAPSPAAGGASLANLKSACRTIGPRPLAQSGASGDCRDREGLTRLA